MTAGARAAYTGFGIAWEILKLDDEILILWQDTLDEIVAGRETGLPCPHCGARPLDVEREGGLTRVSCKACKKYLEGRFGD